jgi:uncharacterized membrane protein YqgA involved in biofilm formation
MLGTVVNTGAIVAGSLIGLLFRGGIPRRFSTIVTQAIGLAVILIGIKTALKTDDILLVIASLALGSLAGEAIGIEAQLERLGGWLGRKVSGDSEGSRRASSPRACSTASAPWPSWARWRAASRGTTRRSSPSPSSTGSAR